VPAFFAEGTDTAGANQGTAFTAFLAAAGPADGNWDNSDNGEAPGQSIFNGGPSPTGPPLLRLQATIFDGCEHSISQEVNTHYLNNFLSKIFTGVPPRTSWLAENCISGEVGTTGAFPGRDFLSQQFDLTPGAGSFRGQAVGWIDLVNTAISCDSATPGATVGVNCPNYTSGSAVSVFRGEGFGVGQRRGVVGVLIENVVNATLPLRLGDVTRLWGDCTPWEGRRGPLVAGGDTLFNYPEHAICEVNTQNQSRCTCSLVDLVEHQDIAQQGSTAAFIPVAGQLP
jgi:hypothetical protein